jgi:hypothetical protein
MGTAGQQRDEVASAAACVKIGLKAKNARVIYARSNKVYRLRLVI